MTIVRYESTSEGENEITEIGLENYFIQKTETFLDEIMYEAIERKVVELFGSDFYAYVNHLLETKQDLDPAKIKALHDYVVKVSILFRQGHHVIASTNTTEETQKLEAIQLYTPNMVNVVNPDEVDRFLEREKGQTAIINIVKKNKEHVERLTERQPCNKSTETKS